MKQCPSFSSNLADSQDQARKPRLNLFFILSCRGKDSQAPWGGLHSQPPGRNKVKKSKTRDPILHLIIIEDDPLRGVLFIPDVADIVARVVGRAHVGDEGVKFVPNSVKYREKPGVATCLEKHRINPLGKEY